MHWSYGRRRKNTRKKKERWRSIISQVNLWERYSYRGPQWSDIFSEGVHSDLKLMPLINDHCTTISGPFFAIYNFHKTEVEIEQGFRLVKHLKMTIWISILWQMNLHTYGKKLARNGCITWSFMRSIHFETVSIFLLFLELTFLFTSFIFQVWNSNHQKEFPSLKVIFPHCINP